ncbi:MAG: tRNA (guanosine(46)-N7)-methyltransferase TrmB [Synergistaceae bacterium]|nr:tRNA (guanosine(46)-N7)-methyltransferase TrmB [Synergistaceae bacterium]
MSWKLNEIIVSRTEALPIEWNEMSPSGRVFVEIGFGNGEFLEYLARANPETLIVGVEVSQWCVTKGARRLLAAGLSNARLMHGDARFLLRHCFAPESVERVYMNFPCPWPKTRHAARRVTVPAFSDLMNYLIAPNGSFELATDVDWYAEETAEVFASNSAFRSDPAALNPERPYVTKYERKWKAMGKDTWSLTIHKDKKLDEVTEREEDWPMEGEAKTQKSVKEVIDSLKGREGAGVGGKGHWVFRDAFISEEGVGLMLVITADDGFEQHFYLKAIPNPRGVTIKVDSVGHPYRTPAMRAALLSALAAAND